MKKLLLSLILSLAALTACGKKDVSNESDRNKEAQLQIEAPSLSNMASAESLSFVEKILKDALASENESAEASVDKFIDLVRDYNHTVGKKILSETLRKI